VVFSRCGEKPFDREVSVVEVRNAGGALERRFNPASPEFRPELRTVAGSATPHIQGYGSVFGKLSRKLGGFVERVNDSAFRSSQTSGWPGVIARYNHSDDWLLGTIQGGTLVLSTDNQGLYYDCEPPSFRSDVIELCRRGDITSSSFAFRVPDGGDDWGLSDFNYPLRTLLDVELVDVAPVNTPAYPDATAAARSLEGAVESLARQFGEDPVEIRSMLEMGQGVKLFKRSDRPSAPIAQEGEEMTKPDKATDKTDERAKLTSKQRNDLPKSSFAHVDEDGVGHFPIHDANHVRNALARIAQGAKYGKEALPKVKAAAKKFGIDSEEQNAWNPEIAEEVRDLWFALDAALEERADTTPDTPAPKKSSKKADNSDKTEEDDEDEAPDNADSEVPEGLRAAPKDDSENPEDDEDDEDDEEEQNAAPAKSEKAAPAVAKPDDDADDEKEDDNDSKMPPALAKKMKMQQRRLELASKKFDPYFFDDEDN
jgi:hypothetical protein